MTQIQLRRDTAANWASVNPVLASGEPAFETDTGKFKIGDGTTAYNSLDYIGAGDLPDNITTLGNTFNGAGQLVQLDSTGKLPAIDGSKLTNLPLDNAVTMEDAVDLNNLTTTGNYYILKDLPNLNTPGKYSGVLCVIQKDTPDRAIQLFYRTSAVYSEVYYRTFVSPDWSEWVNLGISGVDNMVTTDTNQIISGVKDFSALFKTNMGISLRGKITARDSNDGINPTIIDYQNGSGNIILGEIEQYTHSSMMKNVGIEIRQNNTSNDAGLYAHKGTDVYPLFDSSNIPTGALKYWTGTEADYTGLTTKNADTLYRLTDTNKVYLGTIQLGGA